MIITAIVKKEHLLNAIHKIDKEGVSKEVDSNYYDLAIIQKLLQKLHGSRSKPRKSLKVLAIFCLNNKILSKYEEVRKILLDTVKTLIVLKIGIIKLS